MLAFKAIQYVARCPGKPNMTGRGILDKYLHSISSKQEMQDSAGVNTGSSVLGSLTHPQGRRVRLATWSGAGAGACALVQLPGPVCRHAPPPHAGFLRGC